MPTESPAPPSARETHLATVARNEERNRVAAATNSDLLVRRGLLASRTSRWVRLEAEAQGLSGGDPVEFFLISDESGHGYEALATCFARPSDIHAALLFIGMKPGRPVDSTRHHFWPRGERLLAWFEWGSPNTPMQRVPAEELILDKRTGKSLPAQGFVFTGSRWLPPRAGTNLYAADVEEPQAIAANYNESGAVLDLPRRADQGEVYSSQVPNPGLLLPKGQWLTILMEPEFRDGQTRVRVLDLQVLPATPPAAPEARWQFTLREAAGNPLLENTNLTALLAVFGRITEAGQDPFLSITFDRELAIQDAQAFCRVLESLDSERGVRVEGPPSGQLYYKAFMPNDRFRKRSERPSQPWELRVTETSGNWHTTLVELEEKVDDEGTSTLIVSNHTLTASAELPIFLGRRMYSRALFVFAPPTMTCGRLLEVVGPALATHPYIHVYLGGGED